MLNYEELLNPTIVGIQPSGIRRFFDLAEKSDDIISLGVGEPDFPTPWHIREAGIESLQQSKTRYTSNRGLAELRHEIGDYMKRRFELEYDAESEILVTVGGSEAIDLALRTIVKPGDEVLVPEPSFVCYVPLVRLCGGIPVIIDTKAENEFRLTADEMRRHITPKTKAVILPFPSNPTGAVMRREHLEELAEVLRGTDIFVISDEIYAELTYDNVRHTSIANLLDMRERTVVIGGFSKPYSMTGWRLGYCMAPGDIAEQMLKIHQYAIMCAPSTAQYAAIEAMRNGDEDVAAMAAEYDMRRRFVVDGFNKMGLNCFLPQGAFYVFPCIKSTGLSSEDFCERLITEAKIAVVPGTAFGKSGEGFVRVSYCYSIKHIREALRRIRGFVEQINNG